MFTITLYCSSTSPLPHHWEEAARAVGTWIGEHHARLVYGGVAKGLMEIAARACKDAGGKIVGVVPGRRYGLASDLTDVRIPTSELNERKTIMQLLADVFVVLPGGYGTLDELASAFAYINFTNQNSKHIILHNADGIFSPFLEQLRVMAAAGVMNPALAENIHITSSIDQLIEALEKLDPR